MFGKSVYREEALIRKAEPELRDHLLRVTAPRERLLLIALAATMLAAVAWCALANVERTLSGEGAFLRPGDRHAVVPAVSGVVAEVAARPGDPVEAGQTITRLRLPDLDWRLRLARARIDLLEELAGSDGPDGISTGTALASAQAEMIELAAMAAAGVVIVSPHTGEIAASRLAVGQAVNAGEAVAEIRVGAGNPPEAVMLVTREQGEQIAVGMTARVAPSGGSAADILPAEVVAVSPTAAPRPAWLSRFGLASGDQAGTTGRIVRLAIDADADFPDGTACRVEIILSRSSPLGLILGYNAAR